MSRKILLILVLLLGGALLAACGGNQKVAAGQAASETPAAAPASGLTADQAKTLEQAAALAQVISPKLDQQRRGCPACHVVTDKATGKYSLAYEAEERAKARGKDHPTKAPDGTSLAPTQDVNVTTCLECHAAGTGDRMGKGVVAPLSLRDIVHPAHMGSQTFKLHYGGDCFTCHDVNGEGEFTLLTQKVDVNDKGVPNPDKLPIPGEQLIKP
ncbi:MAG: hypothetical protein ACM3PY_11600 [Omnitrophica WOR_2 bacterium]